uniref:Centrosomal protein of 55 kDa-like n=1 Tax=Poecilia latipinna TaxID=48699 RepID=A0A3B3VEL7_9TELE
FQALEKNKQWLEYDQQREAYVRAILDKMLWLEKHLNETNQAHSMQHNEEHSYGESKGQWAARKIACGCQLHKNSTSRFRAREEELEALTHHLKSEIINKGSPKEECHNSEEEEQQLREETQELQARLKEEKRRSTNFELQVNAHDMPTYDTVQFLKLQYQQDPDSCEEAMPPSSSPGDNPVSSSHTSVLNESVLECPTCQNEYPASEYRELLKHLEICLDKS